MFFICVIHRKVASVSVSNSVRRILISPSALRATEQSPRNPSPGAPLGEGRVHPNQPLIYISHGKITGNGGFSRPTQVLFPGSGICIFIRLSLPPIRLPQHPTNPLHSVRIIPLVVSVMGWANVVSLRNESELRSEDEFRV